MLQLPFAFSCCALLELCYLEKSARYGDFMFWEHSSEPLEGVFLDLKTAQFDKGGVSLTRAITGRRTKNAAP